MNVLAIASSLAIVLPYAAQPAAAPLHLALDFAGGMTPMAAIALAEARRIWAPYGVSIDRSDAERTDTVVARVAMAGRASPAATDAHALGSIVFHDGVPAPEIALYEQRAWELICALLGADAERWPTSYRDAVVGRVLGRALAHELGHFLLRTRSHSPTGLMRATLQISDLMMVAADRFFLTADDLKALALARCAPPGDVHYRPRGS